jgi:hypothetical protein
LLYRRSCDAKLFSLAQLVTEQAAPLDSDLPHILDEKSKIEITRNGRREGEFYFALK